MKKILCILYMILSLMGCSPDKDWRTASREPAGIAPDPLQTREAVIQVFVARAWGWRGWFAVHSWITAKRTGAPHNTVYEVVGWRQRRGLPVLRIERDVPDRFWFGETPRLLADHRGVGVDALIDQVEAAAAAYPLAGNPPGLPGAQQQHLHRLGGQASSRS